MNSDPPAGTVRASGRVCAIRSSRGLELQRERGLFRGYWRRDHRQLARWRAGHFLSWSLVQVPEPVPPLDGGPYDADHAVGLVDHTVIPNRVLPVGDGLHEIERVVKAPVGQVDTQLFAP